MNRDEVLEMARQAGYDDPRAIGDCAIFDYFDLERFAALVAERTREECAKVLAEHPGHIPSNRWPVSSALGSCEEKIRSMKAY